MPTARQDRDQRGLLGLLAWVDRPKPYQFGAGGAIATGALLARRWFDGHGGLRLWGMLSYGRGYKATAATPSTKRAKLPPLRRQHAAALPQLPPYCCHTASCRRRRKAAVTATTPLTQRIFGEQASRRQLAYQFGALEKLSITVAPPWG